KMLKPKIFLRRTSDSLKACYDERQFYGQNSLFIITSDSIDLKYLLAIINSKLMNYIYKMKCPQTGKVFAEIKPSIIKELPIREILPSDDFNKNIHDKVIQLVDNILISNVDYKTEMKDADRKILQQK